ncbi:TonB-dependent receptor [Sphingosinicella terrae]|uniref:TonB-dependent receptor n=1 Tax=Sphingosinicella terrae TaxID=2172047 RepID=UPI000E0D45EC|nr:TonB-dependent receptor [Sphingosinicella terrae]
MKLNALPKLTACTVSFLALAAATPALAQVENDPAAPPARVTADDEEILVTAQRRAQLLQDVPISVSAFSGEQLERQQIENASDLQLSLPNVTFTKTNFTSSSFTIRGVGDLCVGFSCDTATAIHVNDMPLTSTRLFETEYFDLERVEVLRGPQGTLYGRNATSGVVNFITARPNLNGFEASLSAEYGNYDAVRLNGMVNFPIGQSIGVRLAGYLVDRDGFTENLAGGRVDDRELYALRGTIRLQPGAGTTLDLIGYYFREDDNRSRIQKQLCNRDSTAILGCAPDALEFETVNGNSTLAAILSSREFFAINDPALAAFGLTSLYGPDVFFGGIANPAELRTVSIDFTPTYFVEEYHLMGRLEQELGERFSLTVTGGYAYNEVDSRTDYNLTAGNSLAGNPGLLTLAATAAAPGAFFPGGINPYVQAAAALIPNGPAGGVCTSETTLDYTGIYGGFVNACTAGSTDYDRSRSQSEQWSVEAHLDSNLDGPLNFLIGGIYLDQRFTDANYYVASFGLDYAAGILGAATALGQRAGGNLAFPNVFLAPPFYNSEVARFSLRSYGLFGEIYWDASERLRFTGGIRYSNDRKRQVARVPVLSWPVPFGLTDANLSPFLGSFDADASTPGNQPYDDTSASFDEITGRLVAEFRFAPDHMLYASYSRGYKSGGINPPVAPEFEVPRTFEPEIINAFEIGSRNDFMDGRLRLNLSAFYYDYGGLQLSRIVARTSVNDNTDAEVYGAELEAVYRPVSELILNASASYLHTRIGDLQLVDPRDVSGGRSDVVIVKDVTNASNCAVIPGTAGNALGTNTFVAAFNSALGLAGPVPVPGTGTTGAFSICNALAAAAADPPAPLRALFGVPAGPLPFTVETGVPVDLSGNALPQAPNWKFSTGVQYTFALGGGWTLVPRADFTYTGSYYARSFNRPIDRVDGYEVINAQLQLNGPEERWFVRAFIQNLTGNDAITGLYVTDQSSGLFTNAFTLEPRRYGLAAGVRF